MCVCVGLGVYYVNLYDGVNGGRDVVYDIYVSYEGGKGGPLNVTL